MKDIFVIRGTLIFFGSLRREIDTIDNLVDIDNKMIVLENYVYFFLKYNTRKSHTQMNLCDSFFLNILQGGHLFYNVLSFLSFQRKILDNFFVFFRFYLLNLNF
jgi:hypothetical protein